MISPFLMSPLSAGELMRMSITLVAPLSLSRSIATPMPVIGVDSLALIEFLHSIAAIADLLARMAFATPLLCRLFPVLLVPYRGTLRLS